MVKLESGSSCHANLSWWKYRWLKDKECIQLLPFYTTVRQLRSMAKSVKLMYGPWDGPFRPTSAVCPPNLNQEARKHQLSDDLS